MSGGNKIVCPKCGSPGSLIAYTSGGRTYYKVYHSKKQIHYIGPAEGYIYVNLIQDLNLSNPLDQNYQEVVLRVIARFRELLDISKNISIREKREAIERMIKLLTRVTEQLKEELEELEKEQIEEQTT